MPAARPEPVLDQREIRRWSRCSP